MLPLISIIVPIYKVEPYLRLCLDSILAQTYQNLEIILVDDGSPDNCGAICDIYAEKDSRIRVIHKENGGLSDARNVGLEIATGSYIGFVDSDDWIAPDMFEYLYRGALEYGADITLCEYYNCWAKKSIATYRPEIRKFVGRDAVDALLFLKIGNYAWNKLYKRELWSDDIRYPKRALYEDVRTTYKLVEKANMVVALPEPKYYYRRTDESITMVRAIRNKTHCVLSRVERFMILAGKYPDACSYMLKEIYGYLLDLQEVIRISPMEEFEKNQTEIQEISSFLRQHEKEIGDASNLGRLGRLSLHFMTSGTRRSWFRSESVKRVIAAKGRFFTWKPVKKLGAFFLRWKESEKKRYYYKICTKLPMKEAAFVESRGGEDLAGNMYEIAQELCRRGIKVYLSVKSKKMETVRCILENGFFSGLEVVEKFSKRYYKAFATSKYWFNDMVFEDAVVKRPEQIYVNTWHGTPLKKLEFDVGEQRCNTGGASRDYLKSDYLAVPSRFLFEKMLTSACVDTLFRGRALYSGYPRNSVFFDAGKRETVRNALELSGKEVFAYMPTWRGNLLVHSAASGAYSTEKILDFFEEHLEENQVMLVKLHNYATESIDYERYKKVRPFSTEFDTYSVLNAADCLITDYSSVFFDFANTRKKIILFTHDREEYLRDRGLYLDLDELPFPKVDTYETLAAQLNLKKDYDDTDFIHTYCTYDCADSVKKLIDYILRGEKTCQTDTAAGNGKKNILIYDTEVQKRATLMPEDTTFLSQLNLEEANYFYCYPQWLLKSTPSYLQDMSHGIRLFTFTKTTITLWTEKLLMKVTGKKTLKTQVRREVNRQIYGQPFDDIQILGNNEYAPFCAILDSLADRRNHDLT